MEKLSAKKMAKKMSKLLRPQKPNYDYLRDLFKEIRAELEIEVTHARKKLPYVPTEDEVKAFYHTVWQAKDTKHLLIVKTLLLTGVRVSELVNIKITDIDLVDCRIRINNGKGNKDRVVPFSPNFKEAIAIHIAQYNNEGRKYLFESRFRKQYSDRGIRHLLTTYTQRAGIDKPISPHKLRHFLFTWLKKKNIDDALIQPYSGHTKRESLEVYSKLSLADAQHKYNEVINEFPV